MKPIYINKEKMLIVKKLEIKRYNKTVIVSAIVSVFVGFLIIGTILSFL